MISLLLILTRKLTAASAVRARRALRCAILSAVLLTGVAVAQGPISAMQEILKAEQLYFGEPSGVLDEPTREALRRYQTRRGLAATGELDDATLKAMQGRTKSDPPAVLSVPPSKPLSATTREGDREFLRKLEVAEPPVAQLPPAPSVVSPPVAQLPPAPPVVQQPPMPAPPPPSAAAQQSLPTPEPTPTPFRASAPQVPVWPEAPATRRATPPPKTKVQPVAEAPLEEIPFRRVERLEPVVPERRVITRTIPTTRRYVEVDDDPDPYAPGGVRIYRSHPASDRGTVIYERRITTARSTPVPVRRAQPVQTRKAKTGLFDRVFQDNDDDDDDD